MLEIPYLPFCAHGFDHMRCLVSNPSPYSFRTRRKSRFEPFHAGTELNNRVYVLPDCSGYLTGNAPVCIGSGAQIGKRMIFATLVRIYFLSDDT